MEAPDLTAAVTWWAHRTDAVPAAVLIGSRQQTGSDPVFSPDSASDWDIQLITTRPGLFRDARWVRDLGFDHVIAYAIRKSLWGGGFKVNLVLPGAEADLLVTPASSLRRLRWLTAAGFHRRAGWTQRCLQAHAMIVRSGWRFLKGGRELESFYRRAVAQMPDPRLDDSAVRQLAVGFFCDYLWAVRKIERGELLAAQRMLHRELAEVNFRLLHELKRRRGERTFWDARRLERVATDAELAALTIHAHCTGPALRAAVEQAASTCETWVGELLGAPWKHPRVTPPAAAPPPPKSPPGS
jgi:hypothetical protein